MRTHLLHVVPAIAPEADSDHGTAANDGTYALAIVAARPVLAIAVPLQRTAENQEACEANDDYWLGGYAGI